MEIKYEPVFGDQSLFDDAHNEATHATSGHGFYKVNEDGLMEYLSNGVMNGNKNETLTAYLIAERRIIRTPTWSVADQKAGKLPEVGAKFKARGYAWECVRILNNTILAVAGDSYCGFELNECTPIESPEEKAARLREEWVSNAYVDFHRLGCELEVLQKEQIKVIYDALLSGELESPSKLKGGE